MGVDKGAERGNDDGEEGTRKKWPYDFFYKRQRKSQKRIKTTDKPKKPLQMKELLQKVYLSKNMS